MGAYVIRKLLYGIAVLWGVATLVFFLFNILPGDPAQMMLGQRADEASVNAIREELGMNQSLGKHYVDYLNDLAKENGVTGSRIMGGGFGGCTINLVRNDLYNKFIADAKKRFNEKYGHEPKVYDVIIGDGSRKIC